MNRLRHKLPKNSSAQGAVGHMQVHMGCYETPSGIVDRWLIVRQIGRWRLRSYRNVARAA